MKSKFNLKKFTDDIATQLASHPENEKFTFQSESFKLTIYRGHRPEVPALLRTRAARAMRTPSYVCTAQKLPRAQAIQLYGNALTAAIKIQEQLDTQGTDLDPEVVKRANRLLRSLESPIYARLITEEKKWDYTARKTVTTTLAKKDQYYELSVNDDARTEVLAILNLGYLHTGKTFCNHEQMKTLQEKLPVTITTP